MTRLDTIIELVSLASRPLPLAVFLDGAPALLARIFRAPVASLYLLEADGATLVMRGNTGFDDTALGRVRMQIGEGLTGLAIADRRPLSVAHAPSHDLFLGFPELKEDRYPVLAVAPVMGASLPIGGVVIQRGRRAFSPADLALLTALAASISSALHRAELVDQLGQRGTRKRAAAGTRRILLTGQPLRPGRALGTLAALQRPSRRKLAARGGDAPERLKGAFKEASQAIGKLSRQSQGSGQGGSAAPVWELHQQILSDARFKERSLELVEQGASIGQAMGQVAREAAHAAVHLSRDAFLQRRARELEDLCDALALLAAGDQSALPSKAILMADHLSIFELLIAARSRPVAVVLSDKHTGERDQDIIQLLGLPALTHVSGLFRWATEGDIALLDAHHGYFHINPSRIEVAEYKAWRKDQTRPS